MANDKTLLSASKGRAGADMASSLACRICRATSLLLTFGFRSSPFFTSAHRTVSNYLPDTLPASTFGRVSTYSRDLARAAFNDLRVEKLTGQVVPVDGLTVDLLVQHESLGVG